MSSFTFTKSTFYLKVPVSLHRGANKQTNVRKAGVTQALFGKRDSSKPSQTERKKKGGGGFSFFGGGKCGKCKAKEFIDCPECKGRGKFSDKTKGNIFERNKCYKCQGFGLISCPSCGGKGLTPEQRGER
mmetsp:Transcript_21650/g.30100  ORF Transcript_21650/g.30100 Transcript_21650/m.30100 type:complete len:130 (+) Transcript_21650:208-597(+)